jgi:hypothetical protein
MPRSSRPIPVRGLVALAFAGAAAPATRAQERIVFSLSSSASTPFGTLNDTELAQFDPSTGVLTPWLRDATAAFYTGDLDGDGKTDVWKDVDALGIVMAGPDRVGEVYLSFNTGFGSILDGDIVRLAPDGTLEVVYPEAQIASAFGCTDGNIDVDALHVFADGSMLLSFAEDEASSLFSTDTANVITDGSVLHWDPAQGVAGVTYTEGQIDQFVSNALGVATKTGDTLSIAVDSNGVFCFSVQSPTSNDATVFTDAAGGSIKMSESSLGLASTAEIDALDFMPASADFLTSHAPVRSVGSAQQLVIDVDGAANRDFVVLLALGRGDTSQFPLPGFKGLALPVTDPLLLISLSGVSYLFGKTDAAGHGSITLPNAPQGLVLTLFAQPFDLDEAVLGTPLAAELTG